MNDPPSRSWSGFGGRCSMAKSNSQKMTDETLVSFRNLIGWAENEFKDYKEQISQLRKDN